MTKIKSTEAKVVKLRIACRAPGHISDDKWQELLKNVDFKLKSTRIERLRFMAFGVSASQTFQGWICEELEKLEKRELLVVDACIDPNESDFRPCLESLNGALHVAYEKGLLDKKHVLVVVSSSTTGADSLFKSIEKGATLYGRVAVITAGAEVIGDCGCGANRLSRLSKILKPWIDPDSDHVALRRVRSHLLRERGVFQDTTRGDERYFAYRYTLEEGGHNSAAKLLESLIKKQGSIRYVLVDTTSSPWMVKVASCLEALVANEGVQIIKDKDFSQMNSKQQLQLIQSLTCAADQTMVLCGVTRSGNTSRRILKKFNIGNFNARINVALLCHRYDSDSNNNQDSTDINKIWNSTSFSTGTWYYLLPVSVKEYSNSDWQVRAAKRLNEVRDLGMRIGSDADWEACSQVGLWDLIASLGVGPETITQVENWRNPSRVVSYIPRIAETDGDSDNAESSPFRMDMFDANWLAEALIRRFVKESNECNYRNQLVVVVPEPRASYGSGTDKIVNAMLHTRRVKCLKIARDSFRDAEIRSIEGRDKEYCLWWAPDTFVLFDETVVSGGTLEGLQAVLRKTGIKNISIAGTVFDAGWNNDRQYKLSLFSLCQWNHIAEK